MFAVRDIIIFAVLAGAAAAAVLAGLPWTRHWARPRGRWLLAGLATGCQQATFQTRALARREQPT